MIRCAAVGLLLVSTLASAAEGPPLICFGNEPSWGLALDSPETALLTLPDELPVEYEGASTRLDVLGERVWRGKPRGGVGGDLVALLRESKCSDGMSDKTHPVTARVSLPDGRFLAGCCRITSAASAAATLEGSVWRLVDLHGQDAATLAELPSAVTLEFENGRLRGFGGCNRVAGSYRIDRDRMIVEPLAGTMMACPEPAMAIEKAFGEAFSGALHFRIAEGRMTLAAEADADPRLVFEAAPPPRLDGTTWDVTGFNNGRQAVVGTLSETHLTVSFQDGSIVGDAGCNSFRASYSTDGNRLSVGATAATRKACDAKGVMEQEREFLSAIESAATWAIDRELLDIHRADGERVLMGRKAASNSR